MKSTWIPWISTDLGSLVLLQEMATEHDPAASDISWQHILSDFDDAVSVQNPKRNSKMKTKSIFQLPLRHLWCRFVRDSTPSPWTSCRYSWSFTPWLLHWSSAERCRTSKNEASCWRSSGLSLVQNPWHQGPESYILTRVSTPKHWKGDLLAFTHIRKASIFQVKVLFKILNPGHGPWSTSGS